LGARKTSKYLRGGLVSESSYWKALEIYTAANQTIQNIDENEDLEMFRSSLYQTEHQSRLDIVHASSESPLQRTCFIQTLSWNSSQQISRNPLKEEEEDEEYDNEDEYEDYH
uniref:Uncharacterized protein n=1 Tax=Podarcis muralis TaxID=64176 RepID=A0A670J9K3_PODMU